MYIEKKYRDQALKKLRLYISKKNEWSDLDLDKLWKALFYCMWMSDKRTIQEELSTSLSLLIHQFTNVNLSLAFVHSFFRTMHREWPGIDGLRLDKFYSLIRKFIHQSLVLLGTEQVQWEMSFVKQFVNILEEEILCCGNSSSNGLRLHVIDLFLTEVFLSSHQKIRTKVFSVLIKPFFQILQKEKDKNVVKRVIELVFEPMINNTYHFQCTGSSSSCSPHQNKAHQNQKEEEEKTDEEEEEEEEIKVFDHVELVEIQHQIFDLAAAE
jgi:ribosomal RNA-processing protein 1